MQDIREKPLKKLETTKKEQKIWTNRENIGTQTNKTLFEVVKCISDMTVECYEKGKNRKNKLLESTT